MNKKELIILGTIILVITILVLGVYFIRVLFIQMKHEDMLKHDTDILCLTLSIAHSCDTEHYNDVQLKKYLKERILTKISLQETEQIVLNDYNITSKYCEQKIECTEYSLQSINRTLEYYNKLLPIIKQLKQEKAE